MFYYLPIEPLPERYTQQMYDWVIHALEERRIPYHVIAGQPLAASTAPGQFLNWTSTIAYKASQLITVAELFHRGAVKNGDIFFVGDIWFPGIESIAYMRDMLGLDVKMYGINYAGPFDPTDLTFPMLYWGKYQEAAWLACFERIFVGSEFHKTLIKRGLQAAGLPPELELRIQVTGLVWDECAVQQQAAAIEDSDPRPLVMWPHRLSPDKNIGLLYDIARQFDKAAVRFLITSSRAGQQFEPLYPEVEFKCVTKAQYYGYLQRACLMLSTAYHENFGYTVREATALGTPVLCPRRADYPEMILSQENLYLNTPEAVQKVRAAVERKLPVATLKQMEGLSAMLRTMRV